MNRHNYVRFRFRQTLVESKGFYPVAMGRPEAGVTVLPKTCYQSAARNEREYRFIVIDTEAGMEHISRGTIGKPDIILIVSDSVA